MEFVRIAKKLGNSSGVILPKKLLGSEVKIIVLNRQINIKKEILKIIAPYLEDILGAYILNRNPIEILIISSAIKKIIMQEKMRISFVPLSLIKKDLKKEILKQKLMKAEAILNKKLLIDLKKEIEL